jgi:hypothetical protein
VNLSSLTKNQKILIGAGVGVVVLLVLALVVFGGGGDGEEEAVTTTTSTTEATTTTTTEPPAAPLTGVPTEDEARRNRPALIVKVDNTQRAMGVHEGLEKADVVFVEQVEQGVTRLAAVFQSEDETVGPVRSARTTDLGIAGNLNMPLFAYSGANGGVLRMVRGGPMIDVGIDNGAATRVYTRNQRGSGLLRFFLPTEEMYAETRADEAGTPPKYFTFRGADDPAPAGETATGVQVGYGGNASTVIRYEWDGSGFARSQYGVAHVMADSSERIKPANVIVQFVDYRSSGFIDSTGSPSPEAVLEGEGEAWVFTDGKLIRGRWSRPTRGDVTQYLDAGGQPIALTPGRTWIELAPGPGSATVL